MSDEKNLTQERLKDLPVKAGQKYRHFKGGEYEVIAVGVKEDTLEPLVIYRSFTKNYTWVRTFDNWNEEVEVNGQRVKRFTLLS